MDYTKKGKTTIANIIENTISDLLSQSTAMQDIMGKLPIKYIYISFLRSSVANRLPPIRIDAYNEKDLSDVDSIVAYPELGFITEQIYNMNPVDFNPQTHRGQAMMLEVEQQWMKDFEILFDEISDLLADHCYNHLLASGDKGVTIYCGEYFGTVRKLQ